MSLKTSTVAERYRSKKMSVQ